MKEQPRTFWARSLCACLCVLLLAAEVSAERETDANAKLSYSQRRVVKEADSVTVWCKSNRDDDFSSCEWTLPGGDSCFVAPDQKCLADDSVKFVGDQKNCSVRIGDVSEKHNGIWRCSLKKTASSRPLSQDVILTVAQKAKVEFVELYGTVVEIVGTPANLTCEAKHGRPAGHFEWRIGEAKRSDSVLLRSGSQPEVVKDSQGLYSVRETITYIPEITHNDKRFYCIYKQVDEIMNPVFAEEDHVTMSLYFLEEPKSAKMMPSAEVGSDAEVSLFFHAVPRPENRDIVWVIRSDSESKELILEEAPVRRDNYVAAPLRAVGDDQYVATLTIENVQAIENDLDHHLRISNRDHETKDVFMSKTHRFLVRVHSSNERSQQISNEGPKEGGLGTFLTILIICLSLLLLLIIVGGVAVFWARQSERWCFEKRGVAKAGGGGAEPELEAPLNDEEREEGPNARPIIRPEYRRPNAE